ncbi:MAG: PilZ domain-containing protein [Phycisphaerae bacterium]|jgi:hypothetical protein
MSYAIDLNERQSTRTLEQAIRHQAPIILEPRIWEPAEHLHGQLIANGVALPRGRRSYSAPLVVAVPPSTSPATPDQPASTPRVDRAAIDRCQALVGTYCDCCLHLAQNRYLFSADVTSVELGSKLSGGSYGGIQVYLTRPETIQVAQRRRFRRIQLPQSSQIEIRWRNDDGSTGGGVGWLYNIGQDGIACRTDTLLADRLWIGQEVALDFSLRPGEPEHYRLNGIVCNKTPSGSADRTILGIQFAAGPGQESTAPVREALQRRLRAMSAAPAGIQKGVDA